MPDLKRKIEEINEVAEEFCTEWEYEFMQSVTTQFEVRGSLSDRQKAIVDRIYDKACDSPF